MATTTESRMAMRTLVADRGRGEPISLGAALMAGKKVAPDVTNLLTEDHRTVAGWFQWYEQAPDAATKEQVARSICKALRAHMAAEEEIFYPHAREDTGDDELVEDAIEEHTGAKSLMEWLERSKAVNDKHASTMRELETEILAHVAEEEGELFPEVRASGMNRHAVGAAVAARRVEYLFNAAAGSRDQQLEEFPAMAISQEEARSAFIVGLKNAHATAREGRTMVEAQTKRLENYPDIKTRLETHLEDKDAQLGRIEKILEDLGESRSAFKDAAMTTMATLGNAMNATAGDEVIKNSFGLLALAKFEAAAYETLILFGEAAGEQSALRPLQKSLSEERAIASFVEDNLRPTGMRFLQLKSEGRRAKH